MAKTEFEIQVEDTDRYHLWRRRDGEEWKCPTPPVARIIEGKGSFSIDDLRKVITAEQASVGVENVSFRVRRLSEGTGPTVPAELDQLFQELLQG